MQLQISSNPAQALATALTRYIDDNQNHQILCLVSGGSALSMFTALELSENSKRRTIFMMGDERVSGEVKINNYLQLNTLLSKLNKKLTVIDSSCGEQENLEIYTSRLNEKISEIISAHKNLKIISMLGVGSDGHTAGIFPLEKNAFNSLYQKQDTYYVPVYLQSLTIDSRASITPNFILNKADAVYAYVAGVAKANVLKQLIETDLPIHKMPAQLIKAHKNSLVVTDIELQT